MDGAPLEKDFDAFVNVLRVRPIEIGWRGGGVSLTLLIRAWDTIAKHEA